jgi:hypothetical protein
MEFLTNSTFRLNEIDAESPDVSVHPEVLFVKTMMISVDLIRCMYVHVT